MEAAAVVPTGNTNITVRHPAAEKMEASAFRKKRSVLNSQVL